MNATSNSPLENISTASTSSAKSPGRISTNAGLLQQATTSATRVPNLRRRRSRSPDAGNLQLPKVYEGSLQNTIPAFSRKQRSSVVSNNLAGSTRVDVIDNGLPASSRLHSTSHRPIAGAKQGFAEPAPPSASHTKLRKDKHDFTEHDAHSSRGHHRLPASHLNKELPSIDRHTFSGPLAVAEFERMRKEIETLKKSLHDSKKIARRQAKIIEDLNADIGARNLAAAEREREVTALKSRVQKSETVIATIEASLQCQICMDVLQNPQVLAPCGHVLCLLCLQEWFRKAPPAAQDMDLDPEDLDNPQYVINRPKSCPCCRSIVKHRPAPIFIVKSIIVALSTSNSGSASANGESLDGETDSWAGIFPPSDDEEQSSEEVDSDDFEDAVNWAFHGTYPLGFEFEDSDSESNDGEDNDEEEDEEEDDEDSSDHDSNDDTPFVLARWEPPSVEVDLRSLVTHNPLSSLHRGTLDLLRRGCSMRMIRMYRMAYAHDTGIIAHVRSLDGISYSDDEDENNDDNSYYQDRVFLGWNISLDEAADPYGEIYMECILNDIKDCPERWVIARREGVVGYDVKKLVRLDEVEEYSTTDTEVWLDAEDND